MRIRRALVPLTLVVCTALSACGGDDGGDSSASSDESTSSQPASSQPAPSQPASSESGSSEPDDGGDVAACDLLTPDAVEAAVGAPVKTGIPTSGPAITGGRFTTCVWQSADPDNPADSATVTIYPNADAADSVREGDSEAIDGIGDSAFIGSFASVWVYAGEKSFFAQWYAFSGADEANLPKSQALAKAVVDALG